MKIINFRNTLKFTSFLILVIFTLSCTETEDNECETETICFGDGSCIEQPTGDCFDFN